MSHFNVYVHSALFPLVPISHSKLYPFSVYYFRSNVLSSLFPIRCYVFSIFCHIRCFLRRPSCHSTFCPSTIFTIEAIYLSPPQTTAPSPLLVEPLLTHCHVLAPKLHSSTLFYRQRLLSTAHPLHSCGSSYILSLGTISRLGGNKCGGEITLPRLFPRAVAWTV